MDNQQKTRIADSIKAAYYERTKHPINVFPSDYVADFVATLPSGDISIFEEVVGQFLADYRRMKIETNTSIPDTTIFFNGIPIKPHETE